MQARPPQRAQPDRDPSAGPLMPPYRHDHAAGEFTPEVSPLDQFIAQNRMLKKQLQHTERGVPPRTSSNQYREPHSGTPGYSAPINEDEDHPHGNDGAQGQERRDSGATAGTPLELRMPRFSTMTTDSFAIGDRDSMYSNDRDSTILGAFSFGFNAAAASNAAPDIQSAPKNVTQESNLPRDSVRPVISRLGDEDVYEHSQPQTPRAEYFNSRESIRPVISSVDDEDPEYPMSPTSIHGSIHGELPQDHPVGPPDVRPSGPGERPRGPPGPGGQRGPMGPPGPGGPGGQRGPGGPGGQRGPGGPGGQRGPMGPPGPGGQRGPGGPGAQRGPGGQRGPMGPGGPGGPGGQRGPGGPGGQRGPGGPGGQRGPMGPGGQRGPGGPGGQRGPMGPGGPGQRGPGGPGGPNGQRGPGGPGGPGGLRGPGGPGGPGTPRGKSPGPGPDGDRRPSPEPTSRRPPLDRALTQPAGPHPRPQMPARSPSGANGPPKLEAPYQQGQYRPYRKDSTSSPTGYHSPVRANSAENGRFPAPIRTGSSHSDRMIPVRSDSRNSDRHFGPPSRQDSNDADGNQPKRYVPYRQGSGDSLPRQNSMERSLSRGSPSPQPLSILPMISDIRVGSPDSDRGPPTAIPDDMRSPNPYEIERSPSAASMYSVGGTRKGFNFSRPTLSNKPSVDSLHRPTIEIPSRNLPQDHEEAVQTPTSPGEGGEEPAQTYLYAKFDLPRGRALGRNSAIFQDPAGVEQNPANALSSAPGQNDMLAPPQRSQSSSAPNSPRLPPDNSTLKPNAAAAAAAVALPPKSPHVPPSPAASIAPDEHLKMGIDLHEKGSLNESTYHLRCAARGGHPTGMLLYALACRHGWGMRPNQREGVEWLKKVTQLASSEVADDENGISNMPFMEKQGRRNQFALSIYELGVSHLNGWGTEMDKGLALNCFEIAGKWGDPDALSEAGFCYANGVGTKKDMKKAAKFYRMAEAKGVNMVGNSWIWKDKYLDDEDRAIKQKKEGGGGKKEKDGGLFSRKKSVAT